MGFHNKTNGCELYMIKVNRLKYHFNIRFITFEQNNYQYDHVKPIFFHPIANIFNVKQTFIEDLYFILKIIRMQIEGAFFVKISLI